MSIYNNLISFLERDLITNIVSEFGFDTECYYDTNSSVPNKEQIKLLKERLLLILSLPFYEKFDLEKYITNPYLYRKDLGPEFNWVRTSMDVINFRENKNDVILREFDPLLKV